jgi:hypothetical protein
VSLSGVDSTGITTGSKTGFLAGVFLDLPVGDVLSIQPEAIYVQKHFTVNDGGGVSTQKWDFIEIPILVKLNLTGQSNPGFYVLGGPSVDIVSKANSEDSTGHTKDNKDNIQSTGFNVIGGVGLSWDTLGIEVRYDAGLKDLNKSLNSPDPASNLTVKDHSIQIVARWSFK